MYNLGTIDLHWSKMTVVKVAEDLLKFAGNGLKPKAKSENDKIVKSWNFQLGSWEN